MFIVKSLVLVVAVCYLGHPKNLLIDWRAASRSGGEFQTKHGFQTCCLRPSRPSRETDSWKLVSAQRWNVLSALCHEASMSEQHRRPDRSSPCLSEWFAASDTDVGHSLHAPDCPPVCHCQPTDHRPGWQSIYSPSVGRRRRLWERLMSFSLGLIGANVQSTDLATGVFASRKSRGCLPVAWAAWKMSITSSYNCYILEMSRVWFNPLTPTVAIWVQL